MSAEGKHGRFQACGACRRVWLTWDDFVLDPDIRLLGLQAVISHPHVNLLVFEHACGSSISILARRLRHLLPAPALGAPASRLLGTQECRGHCRRLEDIDSCDAPCSNAHDRELTRLVARMKKAAQEDAPA